MPLLGLLHFLIAIGCLAHIHSSGAPQFWNYVVFLPGVGPLAYLLFEVLPGIANTRRGRRVATDMRSLLDPDHEWRRLQDRFAVSDTIEAKCHLAEECERKSMWKEAIALYTKSLQGAYENDPHVLKGLARAQLGGGDAAASLATLERLRSAHPDYQNQEAHLTYARALEAQNRLEEAEREYRTLSAYFVGLEARTRWALLLEKIGQPAQARHVFADVEKASKARGVVLSDADRDWLKVARRNLAG